MESAITEDQLQASCVKWFWNEHPTHRYQLFAVPNGGHRNYIEALKFKATGVLPGVADLILILLRKTVFIEMKTLQGEQSKDQKKFEVVVRSLGHEYYVVRTLEGFKELINKLLYDKPLGDSR